MLVAPLGFCSNKVDLVQNEPTILIIIGFCFQVDITYMLFKEFYCNFFCYLHSISSVPNGILHLSCLFEDLMSTSCSKVMSHLASISNNYLKYILHLSNYHFQMLSQSESLFHGFISALLDTQRSRICSYCLIVSLDIVAQRFFRSLQWVFLFLTKLRFLNVAMLLILMHSFHNQFNIVFCLVFVLLLLEKSSLFQFHSLPLSVQTITIYFLAKIKEVQCILTQKSNSFCVNSKR